MASIQSVLIKTCMANIQKEISQLEHWLLNVPAVPVAPAADTQEPSSAILQNIYHALDRLSKDMKVQQMTIEHMSDRLDVLETNVRYAPESEKKDNRWMEPMNPLDDNEYENLEDTTYLVKKEQDEVETSPFLCSARPSSPEPQVDLFEPPVTMISSTRSDEPTDAPLEPKVAPLSPPSEQKETTSITLSAEEEGDVVEEEEEVEVVEEEEGDVVEVEEVQEEEVVEEEQSLEEFEYKGVRYCKDSENNVYGLDDDDTPSEQPIGHWSQKQQAIMFYKTK